MKKSERIHIAKNTLEILERGDYVNRKGEMVSIRTQHQYAMEHNVYYDDNAYALMHAQEPDQLPKERTTEFEVVALTTLEAMSRLVNEGVSNIVCLNFASAKNPGGGFLNGSQAQEESLARSTGLYPTLIRNMAMYHFNRSLDSCLYSDHMIYSPGILVLKDDEGELLDTPYTVSVITSPAVNAGVVCRNEPDNVPRIGEVMMRRMDKVLSIAAYHGHRNIILGAWGCGVFQNEPSDVAGYFASQLKEGKFRNVFDRVVFAIKSKEPRFIAPFQSLFDREAQSTS